MQGERHALPCQRREGPDNRALTADLDGFRFGADQDRRQPELDILRDRDAAGLGRRVCRAEDLTAGRRDSPGRRRDWWRPLTPNLA